MCSDRREEMRRYKVATVSCGSVERKKVICDESNAIGPNNVDDRAMSSVSWPTDCGLCVCVCVCSVSNMTAQVVFTYAEKCARRPCSTSPQTCCTMISSARVDSFAYWCTSSSKIVLSGASTSSGEGSGKDDSACARARKDARWLISVHSSRKNCNAHSIQTIAIRLNVYLPVLLPRIPSQPPQTER